MGAGGRGLLPGARRPRQHGVRVTGRLRVMGDPGRIGGPLQKRCQHTSMQRQSPMRGQRLLDGEPRQLVPERHPAGHALQHPGPQSLVQTLHFEDQVHFGVRRNERDHVQHRRRGRAEPGHPGKHRVPHGQRNIPVVTRQHLGHEERVPAGRLVQRAPIPPVLLRQLTDRVRGERRHAQPPDRRALQLAEQPAQRMLAAHLVTAVRGDHQRRNRPDPPAEHAQHVHGRLVRPVQVLQHQHQPRPRPHVPHDPGRQLVRLGAQLDQLVHLQERPERPRGPERITGPPEHRPGRPHLRPELPHQRGLPAAGLPAQQHQNPAPGGGDRGVRVVQGGQLRGPLEQPVPGRLLPHRRTMTPSAVHLHHLSDIRECRSTSAAISELGRVKTASR